MSQQFEAQWDKCLDIIRQSLRNDEVFNSLFAPVRAGSFKDGKLTLLVPSHYVYEESDSDQ